MTEKQDGKWLVHPKTGIAHYTRPLFDPALSRMTICKLEVDDSWTSIEEPERKCQNCEKSLEMDKMDKAGCTSDEKMDALTDLYKRGKERELKE